MFRQPILLEEWIALDAAALAAVAESADAGADDGSATASDGDTFTAEAQSHEDDGGDSQNAAPFWAAPLALLPDNRWDAFDFADIRIPTPGTSDFFVAEIFLDYAIANGEYLSDGITTLKDAIDTYLQDTMTASWMESPSADGQTDPMLAALLSEYMKVSVQDVVGNGLILRYHVEGMPLYEVNMLGGQRLVFNLEFGFGAEHYLFKDMAITFVGDVESNNPPHMPEPDPIDDPWQPFQPNPDTELGVTPHGWSTDAAWTDELDDPWTWLSPDEEGMDADEVLLDSDDGMETAAALRLARAMRGRLEEAILLLQDGAVENVDELADAAVESIMNVLGEGRHTLEVLTGEISALSEQATLYVNTAVELRDGVLLELLQDLSARTMNAGGEAGIMTAAIEAVSGLVDDAGVSAAALAAVFSATKAEAEEDWRDVASRFDRADIEVRVQRAAEGAVEEAEL
ncbi:MAG: hypothetical protein LUC93_14715 [Planctomycetaceae bacterium]|nr:hypothetical protein [Planctomycetaceae bacterium]